MSKKRTSKGNFEEYEDYLEPQPGDTGDDSEDEFDFLHYEQFVAKNEVKHHVTTEEIRQVFAGRPRERLAERGHRAGEDEYYVLGRTDSGRRLVVFYIRKSGGVIMPLSARTMSGDLKGRYEKK